MIPHVLPTYNRAPIAFTKGEGSWLTAEDVITRSRQTYVDLRLAETRAWLALERSVGRHLSPTLKEHEGGSS